MAGALTNSGTLIIGNSALSAPDKLTAASLDKYGLDPSRRLRPNQALLDVTAGSAGFGTAGTLSGSVGLSLDSAIEFASGQISTIAADAQLSLIGNDAFIEDSTALGSNSALTGLASIIAGSLNLIYGAAVSTTGSLVIFFFFFFFYLYYFSFFFYLSFTNVFIYYIISFGSNSALTGLVNIAGVPRTLGGLAVDDRGGRQQRPCQSRDDFRVRRFDPVDRGRADQHRHAEYR